jgi:hypothetical protein
VSRVSKIVLIFEGWRDSSFARGFLVAAGINPRVIELRPNPGGSGHDWVKEQFVVEVGNLRRFSEGRGVLALLDEDGFGTQNRQREVETLLTERQLPPISAHEGRCLILPTRNIETWLYWLRGYKTGSLVAVDEADDYKQRPPIGSSRIRDEECRPAGETLHQLDHTRPPNACPPQLIFALTHLRVFLNTVRR